MFLISTIYKTFIDALFPLSQAEQELFVLQPREAYDKLPRAPGYGGLAVPLTNSSSIFAYKDERVAKLVWNVKYKKSAQAIGIGGYALLITLESNEDEKVSRDTPSTSGEVAAGSPSSLLESADSPSLSPKRPSKSFSSSFASTPTIVIPMPITTRRRKERGYNQCELLVDEMERLAKNSDNCNFIFEKDLLVRTQHASRQTLKGRMDRVESSKGIFGVDEKVIEQLRIQLLKDLKDLPDIKKIPVIIIDDVITTGSTMFEAIETLKKSGFEDVRGISLAH